MIMMTVFFVKSIDRLVSFQDDLCEAIHAMALPVVCIANVQQCRSSFT